MFVKDKELLKTLLGGVYVDAHVRSYLNYSYIRILNYFWGTTANVCLLGAHVRHDHSASMCRAMLTAFLVASDCAQSFILRSMRPAASPANGFS